jgi:hypothetical protein
MGLGHILVDFITLSSGHPASRREGEKEKNFFLRFLLCFYSVLKRTANTMEILNGLLFPSPGAGSMKLFYKVFTKVVILDEETYIVCVAGFENVPFCRLFFTSMTFGTFLYVAI